MQIEDLINKYERSLFEINNENDERDTVESSYAKLMLIRQFISDLKTLKHTRRTIAGDIDVKNIKPL